MSRAARQGALHIGTEEKLGKALETYATAMEKVCPPPVPSHIPPLLPGLMRCMVQVGDARLQQDEIIVDQFITPWQATLSSSIALANKARANVKTARLELDTARAE
jgi:hypothetical protein